MDSRHLRLEFVALDDASDHDRSLIEGILFHKGKKEITLPWNLNFDDGKQEAEDEPEVEEAPVPEPAPSQVIQIEEEPPATEWAQQTYEEPEMGPEVPIEGPPVRPYPQQFYPMFSVPYTTMQYYPTLPYGQPYYPEQPHNGPDGGQVRQPRPKKNEKHAPAPQFIPYYPVQQFMSTGPPQPFYPPPPYQMEYPPAQFIMTPEQQAYPSPEQQYHHENVEMTTQLPPPPKVQENVAPTPESYEHFCYSTDVTLKAPKKKPAEEVAAAPAIEPAAEPPAPTPTIEPPPVPIDAPVLPEEPIPEKIVAPLEESVPQVTSPPVDTVVAPITHALIEPAATSVTTPVVESAMCWANLFQPPPPQPTTTPKPLARVPPARRQDYPRSSEEVSSLVKPDNAAKIEPASMSSKYDNRITDDPYTVQLGEKLRSYELDHKPANITPHGLTNPGNYCYINAILQALIACPPFFNLINSLPVPQGPSQVSRIPIIGSMIELCKQFPLRQQKVKRRDTKPSREEVIEISPGTSFEPKCIYSVLDKIRGSLYSEGRQEDAEEFLSCLLNKLNDEMFEVLKLVGAKSQDNHEGGEAGADSGDWQEVGRGNKAAVTNRVVCGDTPISKIFRGTQKNGVSKDGSELTFNVQPFFTLQLDVEKANSVKDALANFANKVAVEGGVTCPRTNKEVQAWQQTTLEELPLTLILHLKYFVYKNDVCSKLTKTIDFEENLKIEPRLTGNAGKIPPKQKSYKLLAVVYHDGKEATKGHYITDVYHVGLGTWIRYDDGNVRSVREDNVFKPVLPRVPYLLVYRRGDTVSAK